MPYTTQESAEAVVLTPSSPATATVIWLHGLGADGFDFVPIVNELRLPATLPVRFIFPHAAPRPVTLNNGFVMRAWYDILGLGPGRPEDAAGIRQSEGVVRGYIEREVAAGIGTDRIVVAGFSQGGAIALQTALRYPERLAGVLALSTYLPLAPTLEKERAEANRDVPIFMAHGSYDDIIPLRRAETSKDLLVKSGYNVEWNTYPMPHSVCADEIADISRFLATIL